MVLPTPRTNESEHEYHLRFGEAMSWWADLEFYLSLWFSIITKMPKPMARQVFYSARSFQGRSAMFEAALKHASLPNEYRAFLSKAIATAIKYNTTRNTLAHGVIVENGASGRVGLASNGKIDTHENHLQIEELIVIGKNFHDLSR